jgi:hypothetical protein
MSLTKASYSMINGAPVNVKDFGARGDGTGVTPADEGVDISGASWNTWVGTQFYPGSANYSDSPFNASLGNPNGAFVPPTPVPFKNTDSWDYIGCNLALWSGNVAVYFPAGEYKITMTDPSRLTGFYFTGLFTMRGQAQNIYGDGPTISSVTAAETPAELTAVGQPNGVETFNVITFFRTAGPLRNIYMMAFGAPAGYPGGLPPSWTNVRMLGLCNGMTFRNLYIGGCDRGISFSETPTPPIANTHSDNHILSTIFEDNLQHSIFYNPGSIWLFVSNCNFGGGVGKVNQIHVQCTGTIDVTFVQNLFSFTSFGAGIRGGDYCSFVGNTVNATSLAEYAIFGGSSNITGNYFNGTTANNAMLRVESNTNVVGNVFDDAVGGNKPILAIGDNTAASGSNIVISGNTFIKNDPTVSSDNFAIVAPETGVSNTSAATQSCIISNNTFEGRALQVIGSAVLTSNTFEGVFSGIQSNVVPSSNWSFDGANTNSKISLANDATYDLAAGGGLVMITNDTSGYLGLFVAVGNGTKLVTDAPAGTNFSITFDNAGTTNFYYNGATALYRIQNKTGGTVTYYVVGVKAKPTV